MNQVISVLREHIKNQNVRFVFPSQTSAGLWARKTCTLGITRSAAAGRFLAWDRFKEEVVQKKEGNRAPVSVIIRKLFSEALLRKNAAAAIETSGSVPVRPEDARPGGAHPGNARRDRPDGFPLRSLVPPEHAQGCSIFVQSVARILPSLAQWEKLVSNAPGTTLDEEDRDFRLIKKEYAAFLERHDLFEPSWEEIKIPEESNRYVIFFPELIEDFAEYKTMLRSHRFIVVEADTALTPEKPRLINFRSAREEIRSAVMEMQRLHETEDVPFEDMAVSVPELEEMAPCLTKEFSLRHIPVTLRAGKKLGETGAGRFFSLVSGCAVSGFSFGRVKALILNGHIPWKEMEKNRALIDFGIKYNCVSGYVQNGTMVDIWEEAFRQAHNDSKDLRSYYRELKTRTLALAGSKSFADIRKYYFAFRSSFLDMEKITEEDNAVLSRCIEELGSLAELEERFGESSLTPASPFGFFLSCLGEQEYVKSNQKPGVNIFRWRVAAASPFGCHFVLNASQSAASVLYQPMKFLRQDKRKRLGLEDRDATSAFFALCSTGEDSVYKCRIRISASTQTFSGWAIPHSFFAREKTMPPPQAARDPYTEERRFWRMPEETELRELFPMQKRSFEYWKNTLAGKEKKFSFFSSAVPSSSPVKKLLESAILGRDGYLTVTPTSDLNVYYSCAIKWLLTRIFKAGEFSLEAALLDDTSLGILYHNILEELFKKIKNEDRIFDSGHLDIYKRWAMDTTKTAIMEHPAFRGPLAIPLVSPQADGMAKKIAHLLKLEAQNFDGYGVGELELHVSLNTGELLVKGTIDRISISPEGKAVIIDYKTRSLPEQTDMESLPGTPLAEYQMPLYIKLYEEISAGGEGKPIEVQGAYFYSINGKTIKTVMGERAAGKTKTPSREEYELVLEAAEEQIEEFGRKVKALDFIPREVRIGDCFACEYKTICRTAYFLNA